MITPSRSRAANRIQTSSDKTPSAQNTRLPPPIGGLVTNVNLSMQSPNTAYVLENFWPTSRGIEPRGGIELRLSIPNPVRLMFEYVAGQKYFVADDTSIYEWDEQTEIGTTLSPVVTGQTSSDYSVVENQTDGGSFLIVANGSDPMFLFDGATWSDLAITGVDSSKISHVWVHRSRQWGIEKGSMNAWYWGVNSIQGEAQAFPLGGVFSKGGWLIAGATWSTDTGDNLNDRCVFFTSAGEAAVYSGDPAVGFTLDSVYDIGVLLDKSSILSVGGDLIVATEQGLIPFSAVVQKDKAQLKLASLSQPIDDIWSSQVALSGSTAKWKMIKWPEKNMGIIAQIDGYRGDVSCYVVNLETGAWSTFTGWQISGASTLGGHLYIGDNLGRIYRADTGGMDDGRIFVARLCYNFDALGSPAAYKVAHAVSPTFVYLTPFNYRVSMGVDYQITFPAPPDVAVIDAAEDNIWDLAVWDIAPWSTESAKKRSRSRFHSVSAAGRSLAVQLQITSGTTQKLDCELMCVDVTFSTGGVHV